MPSTKKHPAAAQAEAAQERITAQKPPETSVPDPGLPLALAPEAEESMFPPPKLPTPFELADAIQVLKAAIHACQAALATCETIFEKPWPIATDAKGNLYEQVYNVVTDEKQGLQWVTEDLKDIL